MTSSLPVHLLEMVALTHHKAWFRLCCVSREFGMHSQREKLKLRAATFFSTRKVVEKRTEKLKEVFSSITLPSRDMHCELCCAYKYSRTVFSTPIKEEEEEWRFFGQRHSPSETPTISHFRFDPQKKNEGFSVFKYWNHGRPVNHPRFGHTLCINGTVNTVSEFETDGFVTKKRHWSRTHVLSCLVLLMETHYHRYQGETFQGRPEEEGPSSIYYSKNGVKEEETYSFGGRRFRKTGPSSILYFPDGKEVLAEFYHRKHSLILAEDPPCFSSCVAGRGKDYKAVLCFDENAMFSSKKLLKIMDKKGLVVASLCTDVYKTGVMSIYSDFEFFKRCPDSGSVIQTCKYLRIFKYPFRCVEGEENEHRTRGCACIKFVEMASFYIHFLESELNRTELLQAIQDAKF